MDVHGLVGAAERLVPDLGEEFAPGDDLPRAAHGHAHQRVAAGGVGDLGFDAAVEFQPAFGLGGLTARQRFPPRRVLARLKLAPPSASYVAVDYGELVARIDGRSCGSTTRRSGVAAT